MMHKYASANVDLDAGSFSSLGWSLVTDAERQGPESNSQGWVLYDFFVNLVSLKKELHQKQNKTT